MEFTFQCRMFLARRANLKCITYIYHDFSIFWKLPVYHFVHLFYQLFFQQPWNRHPSTVLQKLGIKGVMENIFEKSCGMEMCIIYVVSLEFSSLYLVLFHCVYSLILRWHRDRALTNASVT